MIGGYVVWGLLEKGHSVVGVDSVLPRTESLEFRVRWFDRLTNRGGCGAGLGGQGGCGAGA